MRNVMLAGFLAFAYVLPESAGAAELEQKTTEAFNQYVRITEDRMTEGKRESRTFLSVDTHSYWRFQEKDRGVYDQVESVALSRSVPVLLAWVVNSLLKSIPREYLSRLPISARAALTNKGASASFGASSSIKQLSTQFFLVARTSVAVQNEDHSTVILPIQERTICAPQKS
jgi:hypothetical protein